MSPKEKAQELYDKFLRYVPAEEEFEHEYAKQCALIAVDEIIEAIDWHKFDTPNEEFQYWQNVKQELDKM